MIRYVWLNIETGKFSNSWSEEDCKISKSDSFLNIPKGSKWKLIKYECLNDDCFEIKGFNSLK